MNVNATDFKNQLGRYLDTAIKEPVIVEKSGRPRAVLISINDYENFSKYEDFYWGKLATEAAKEGFLGIEETEKKLKEWSKKADEEV